LLLQAQSLFKQAAVVCLSFLIKQVIP